MCGAAGIDNGNVVEHAIVIGIERPVGDELRGNCRTALGDVVSDLTDLSRGRQGFK